MLTLCKKLAIQNEKDSIPCLDMNSGPIELLTNKHISLLEDIAGRAQGTVGKQGRLSNPDEVGEGLPDPKAVSSDTAHTLILR